jgi:hypothetical protein
MMRPFIVMPAGLPDAAAHQELRDSAAVRDSGAWPAAFPAAARLTTAGSEALRVAVRSAEAPPALLAQADLVVEGPPGLRELLRRLAS